MGEIQGAGLAVHQDAAAGFAQRGRGGKARILGSGDAAAVLDVGRKLDVGTRAVGTKGRVVGQLIEADRPALLAQEVVGLVAGEGEAPGHEAGIDFEEAFLLFSGGRADRGRSQDAVTLDADVAAYPVRQAALGVDARVEVDRAEGVGVGCHVGVGLVNSSTKAAQGLTRAGAVIAVTGCGALADEEGGRIAEGIQPAVQALERAEQIFGEGVDAWDGEADADRFATSKGNTYGVAGNVGHQRDLVSSTATVPRMA
jgi:hypothetical protein